MVVEKPNTISVKAQSRSIGKGVKCQLLLRVCWHHQETIIVKRRLLALTTKGKGVCNATVRVTDGNEVVIVKVSSGSEGAREWLSASVASGVSRSLMWESLLVVKAVAITVTVSKSVAAGKTVAVGVGLGGSGVGCGSGHLVTVSVDDRHVT